MDLEKVNSAPRWNLLLQARLTQTKGCQILTNFSFYAILKMCERKSIFALAFFAVIFSVSLPKRALFVKREVSVGFFKLA